MLFLAPISHQGVCQHCLFLLICDLLPRPTKRNLFAIPLHAWRISHEEFHFKGVCDPPLAQE